MSHPNDRLFTRYSSLQNLTKQASGEAPQTKPVVNEADLKPVLGRSNGQLGLIVETVKMQRSAPLDEAPDRAQSAPRVTGGPPSPVPIMLTYVAANGSFRYWTGEKWLRDSRQAKEFDTRKEAERELARIPKPKMVEGVDESVTLDPQWSKQGNSVRMTIGGKVGSIEVSGKTDPFHFHIEDEVTPRIVRDITRVNRADGSGEIVPPAALRKVYAAVEAKLKELQAGYGESIDEAAKMRVVYLPANQAWQVMFGDSVTGIGDANRSLFNDLEDLKDELRMVGLKLGKKQGKGYEIVKESLDEAYRRGVRPIDAVYRRDKRAWQLMIDGEPMPIGHANRSLFTDLEELQYELWLHGLALGKKRGKNYEIVYESLDEAVKYDDATFRAFAKTDNFLRDLVAGQDAVMRRAIFDSEVAENSALLRAYRAFARKHLKESIDEADPVRDPFTGKVIDPETVRASKLAAWVRANLERKPHPSSKKQMVVRYKGKGVALLSPEGSEWRVETIGKDSSGRAVGKRLGIAANLDAAMKFVAMHLKPNLSEGKVDRAEHKRRVEKAMRAQGTRVVREIDPNEYPKISGMEGPFRFRDGRVLYYDPREGKYYDSKSDMYVPNDDLPESLDEAAAPKKVSLSFGDQVEMNRQTQGQPGEITTDIYNWASKKFGKGASVSITSESAAKKDGEIKIYKPKGRMGSTEIVVTRRGKYLIVRDNQGGGMAKATTQFFELSESVDEGVYSDKAMSMKKVEALIEKKGWMVLRSELSGSEYYIQFSLSGSRSADTMSPKDRHKAIETFVKKNRIPASEYGSEGSGYGFMVFFPGEFKESVTVESLRSAVGLDEAKSKLSGKVIGSDPMVGTRVRFHDDDEDEPGGKIIRIVRENPDWPERTVVRVEWDPEPGKMYGERTDVAVGSLVHESLDEASAEQEAYQKLFKQMLGSRKLADMTADQKRELFNQIEKRWADHPANESEELEEESVGTGLPKLIKQVFDAIESRTVNPKGGGALTTMLLKHQHRPGPLPKLAVQLAMLLQDDPQVSPKDTRVKNLRRYFEKTLGYDDTFAFESLEAESVEESQQIAQTMLQQLGGQKRLAMMTGAKNFMWDGDTRTLSFKIGRNAKGVNYVSITLRNDLYDLKFGAIRAGAMKVKAEETGVYADMLTKMFEKHTGMYLKLAPGDSKMFGQ